MLLGLALRSPLGPTLMALFRLLRACVRGLGPLTQVIAAAGSGIANFVRRRLIVVLGGSVDGSKGR